MKAFLTNVQSSRRSLICTLLLTFTIIAFFLVTAFHQTISSRISQLSHNISSCPSPHIHPPSPQPPSTSETLLTFAEHDIYQSLTPAANTAWDEILPPNGGFLYAADGKGERRVHGISMFHQLHCLQMLRGKIVRLLDEVHAGGSNQGHTESLADMGSKHHHDGDDEHWMHCLDYLRQSVTCCADSTVEPPIVKNGKDIADPNVPHVCRKTDGLWRLSVDSGFREQKAGAESKSEGHEHEHAGGGHGHHEN